jgi:SpoVK/Ycf46/Vps4 family AAA+-type ATPase
MVRSTRCSKTKSKVKGKKTLKEREITKCSVIPIKVNTITDLIGLANICTNKRYFYDCDNLHNARDELVELNNMIGIDYLKPQILNWILHLCQQSKLGELELNNLVLCGPTGIGKTTLAIILAQIYCKLRKKRSKVVFGRRSNMIGSFVGTTAKKTEKLFKSASGGCLILDEGYALGGDGRNINSGDSFSKECVDTLTLLMTNANSDVFCIVLGYEEALRRDFFALNEGLSRRFQWWIKMKVYPPDALRDVCMKMLRDQGYTFKEEVLDCLLHHIKTLHGLKFVNQNAGSIVSLCNRIKMCHAVRVFGQHESEKCKITQCDIDSGVSEYTALQVTSNMKTSPIPPFMYM